MGCVQLWVKEREHEVKRAGVIQIARGNKRSKRKNEGMQGREAYSGLITFCTI